MYISEKEFGLSTGRLSLCRGNGSDEISKKEYMGDKNLIGAMIASNVRSIGGWAFASCDRLKVIWLPKCCCELESTFIYDAPCITDVVVYEPLLEGYNVCMDESRLLAVWLKNWHRGSFYDLSWVAGKEWYMSFDEHLAQYLSESDAAGYNPFLAGGEEDYEEPLNDIEYYKRAVRKNKCNVIMERIRAGKYLQDNMRALYKQYLQDNVSEAMEAIALHAEEAYQYLRLYIDTAGIKRAAAFQAVSLFDDTTLAECRALLINSMNNASRADDIWDELRL